MSRLDQLIDAVRTRFLLQRCLEFGAWSVCCAAAGMLVLLVVARLFMISLPSYGLLVGGAAILCVLVSLTLAMIFSPSRQATAVQMDQTLGLKERFSTALQARGSSDPFARAAVSDAETQAQGVSVKHRFPLRWPRQTGYAAAAVVAAVLADRLMPQFDLLGKEQKQRQAAVMVQKRAEAKEALESALAEVMTVPRVGAAEKSLAEARRELESLLSQEIRDPLEAVKTASRAAAEAEAAKKRIEEGQKYAAGETQKDPFKPLAAAGQGDKADGSVNEAKRALSDGDFAKAAAALKAAADDFAKADDATKTKMAADMKALADQLANIAKDPSVQDRIEKELQKSGATPEQARAMAQEMSKAAAGDRDAQRRVRDMTENLARLNNGGLLPAPKMLEPFAQRVRDMQGEMSGQQRAAEMEGAARQLADAMCKQAGKSGSQAQSQGRSGKSESGGQNQQAQGGDQKQPGGQGQQPQSGQSQGDGQASQKPDGAGLADGQASMEAAIAQLEAIQQEAEMAGAGGGDGQEEGDAGPGWGNQMGQGNNNGQGDGAGPAGANQGGIGEGRRPDGVPAPYTTSREVSKGEVNPEGRILAGWLVKADSIKGESREQLKELIVSAKKDAAEDVEQERIPMRAQKAVREYFDSMKE